MKKTKSHFLTLAFGVSALALSVLSTEAESANTEFGYSGYIKLDAMLSDYSDGESHPLNRDFYIPGLIPVGTTTGNDSGKKEWDMHARQSRFIFTTKTDLGDGNIVGTKIELDSQVTSGGDERISNSYSPRIRQAYFTYNGFLFGQAWSTFMNLSALPETVDFVGNTDATIFVRQSQIRYTHGGFQFAIENPETTISNYLTGGRIITDDNGTPDIVLRYNWKGDWGSLSIAGLSRTLQCDDNAIGCDTDTSASGVSFGGKIKLGSDDIRFVVNSGSGLGRYLGLNQVNGAVFNASGELEAIDSSAFSVAYRRAWNSKWRSNLVFSTFEADNDTTLTGTGVTDTTSSYRVNLMYSPATNLTFGFEVAHAERELESGADGEMDRFQFMAKYGF